MDSEILGRDVRFFVAAFALAIAAPAVGGLQWKLPSHKLRKNQSSGGINGGSPIDPIHLMQFRLSDLGLVCRLVELDKFREIRYQYGVVRCSEARV